MSEPRATSLGEFIEETIKILDTESEEILVEQANPGVNEGVFVTQFNDLMSQPQ